MTAGRNDILPETRVHLPAPPTAPTTAAAAPARARDCPWTRCDSSAVTERPRAGLRIEELFADVESRR